MSKKHGLKTLALTTAAALGMSSVASAGSPVPGKPGASDVVATAIAANQQTGQLDTVLTAATCDYFDGAVVNLLTGNDRYTLFAPTDDAFAKLGLNPGNVCATFEADPAALANILTYHVTDGRRFSNSVFNKRATKMVEMLNGQYIVTNPNLTITDNNGRTVKPVLPFVDVNASNGVIHVIDTVLLP